MRQTNKLFFYTIINKNKKENTILLFIIGKTNLFSPLFLIINPFCIYLFYYNFFFLSFFFIIHTLSIISAFYSTCVLMCVYGVKKGKEYINNNNVNNDLTEEEENQKGLGGGLVVDRWLDI